MDDLVLLRWQVSLWTTGDMLGRPYFMFVVHISPFSFLLSPFSFLKVVFDVTGLGGTYE